MPSLKIIGEASLRGAQAEVAALQRQVESLNSAMARTSLTPMGGSSAGYTQTSRALNQAGRAYDVALASSGAFRVEQVKLNSVIETQTDLLRRQKLGFSEVWGRGAKKRMDAIKREQLALRNMTVRTVSGGIGDGRIAATLAIPAEVPKSWDNLRTKMGMVGYELSSVSRTMLNWGKNTQWAGRQLTAGLTMPIVAFGAASGAMFYKVDEQLTRIQKVYNTTADLFSANVDEQMAAQQELDAVREQGTKTAIDAAKTYGSAMTDTLGVQAELAATGETGRELQAATTEVMKNAMLGEIDYQTATKATIGLQQTLNMSTQELSETWAYMNSVENQTSLSMKDFASAIPIALGPIKQMGGTVQDLGTLLTAMVSRGVQVGKAANAIKATAQRLVRPSKQIQEEFKAITGADIVQIGKEANGNLIEMLKRINEVTASLSNYDRTKAFAGLFGSYQLSTMSAMIDGMGDLEKGIGQTTTAYKVGEQSSKEWFRVQDQEIGKFQQSASGKFKIAVETIKASLATTGEPFLEVATTLLGIVQKIINGFNALPDGAKKGLAWGAIFAAMVGPMIMIVGLLGNFIANFGLGAGAILRMVSGFKLLNKSETAQAILDKAYQKGLYSTANAMDLQAQRLHALTAAMNEHNQVMRQQMGLNWAPGMSTVYPGANLPAAPTAAQTQALYAQQALSGMQSGRGYRDDGGRFISAGTAQELANRKAINRLHEEALVMNRDYDKQQDLVNSKTYKEAQYREQIGKRINTATVGMGAMSVATAATMVSSNETTDAISKWVIIGSLVLPAAKGLTAAIGAGSKAAWSTVAAYRAQAVAGRATAAAGAVQLSRGAKFASALRVGGTALAGMVSPAGLVVTAIAAGAYGIYKWRQHEEAITKEKREQANAMYDQNNLLQDQLEITARSKKELSVTAAGTGVEGLPSSLDLAKAMQNDEAYKPLIADLKSDDVLDPEKQAIAMNKYRDVLESTGGSAEKARLYLEAMFRAAGDGALQAQQKAMNYSLTLGQEFGSNDMKQLWTNNIKSIFNDTDTESIMQQGNSVGKDLADAIASGTKEDAPKTLQGFIDIFNSQMPDLMNTLSSTARDALAKAGVENNEQLANLAIQYRDFMEKPGGDEYGFFKNAGIAAEDMNALRDVLASIGGSSGPLAQMDAMQEGVVKQIAQQLGIEREISTFKELQASWAWQVYTATEKNVVALYKQREAYLNTLASAGGLFGMQNEIGNEQKLQLANTLRQNVGLDGLSSIYQVNAWLAGKLTDETDKNADAVDNVKRKWDGVKFSAENYKSILKDSMAAVQDDLADAAQESLENRAQASMDAAQKAADARSEALENRQDRQTKRFENRWEIRKDKVTEFYDNRIDRIDKTMKKEQEEEDLRQKLFEAEQTRISRAAEVANAGIDFNMNVRTGNLDEAAKIQNDMIAQTQGWALSDAAGAGTDRAQARQDQLSAQKDTLNDLKDARLKAMDDEQDKQAEHLKKMQEQEADSLKARNDATLKALQANWDAEKRNLNDRLELFKAYTARNKKDLDRWLGEVGLSYDDFGGSVMMKGETWSGAIQKSLKKHVRLAGTEIANDQMWEQWADKEAKATLIGMGFKGKGQFKQFMKTGEIPANWGKKNPKGTSGDSASESGGSGRPQGLELGRHEGGRIDGSRKGVARTHKGLHHSEVGVLAQKGEYMVNRDATSKHGDVLDAINNGTFDTHKDRGAKGGVAGGGYGSLVAAMIGKTMMSGFARGIGQSLQNYATKKVASSMASSMGGIFTGTGGTYGGLSLDSEQMANAATIASVGSKMGMSLRDIQIGIMTAITESMLRNVNYGDTAGPDSRGLFQQRDPWGPLSVRMDPAGAAGLFFSALKKVSNRDSLSPWMAAQTVQRSAFSTGSNYQKWWDEAQAIYKEGLSSSGTGMAGFIEGAGGAHRPIADAISRGLHDTGTAYPGVDAAAPIGTPVYAVGNGTILDSYDIRGEEPRRRVYGQNTQDGYRSYGRVIVLGLDGGGSVLYAHLSERDVTKGQKVKGGARIGLSGNTGNVQSSTGNGAHLHFGASSGDPGRFWAFKNGGYTTKDTPAIVHKKEMVVDAQRTKKLYGLVDNFDELAAAGTWNWMMGGTNWGPGNKPVDPQAYAKMVEAVANKGNKGGGPKGTNSTEATGNGSKVRTGTYNVLFSSPNESTQADLSKLFGMTDVLSLTEYAGKKQALTPWIKKQGWNLAGQGENVVAYNRAKYAASKTGSIQINKTLGMGLAGLGKGGARRLDAAYTMLSGGGQKFWQIAAHTIAHIWKSPTLNRNVQQEQFGNLGRLAANLGKDGTPVFIGGDLNNAAQDTAHMSPFTKNGLSSNWNAQTMKGQLGTHGNSFIDYTLFNKAAKLLSTRSIPGLSSDHRAVLSEFEIPQLSKGAANIRWDNTLANLHAGEAVLTKDLNAKFQQGVENFANGGNNTYTTIVQVAGTNASPEEIARAVDKVHRRQDNRLPVGMRRNR